MLDTPARPIDAPDTETMEKRGPRVVSQEEPSGPEFPRRFGGIARLYGAAGMTRIAAGRVCVVGVGGVGSWAAEALARSGVGAITLIDMDHVAESNINRQVVADSTTLGMAKIEVMARRIAAINPDCAVHLVDDFVTVANAAELLPGRYDFVIDCADDFRVKAEIVARCRRARSPVITVGGAGGRLDATRVRLADLSRTEHDPLLAKVRKLLRARYGFTRSAGRRFDVPCVYSAEQVVFALAGGEVCRDKRRADAVTGLSCAGGLGSATHITASFAFVAVGHVLKKLAARPAPEHSTHEGGHE